MKHGPIALIDENMPVVVLATSSPVLEKILGNMEEVAARGGRLIALTEADNYQVMERVKSVFPVPGRAPGARPIVLSPPCSFWPTTLLTSGAPTWTSPATWPKASPWNEAAIFCGGRARERRPPALPGSTGFSPCYL